MANKKILITGGSGLIGSAIANHLANKGYKLNILDLEEINIKKS